MSTECIAAKNSIEIDFACTCKFAETPPEVSLTGSRGSSQGTSSPAVILRAGIKLWPSN
jgi:hypothetical protein